MVHDNTIKYNTPAPHWTECSDVWLIPCLIGLMDFLVIIKNMTRATKRSNWGAGKKKKVCSDMFSFLFRKKDKNNKPFLNTTCPDPFKCHSQVGICWQIFHIFLKSRRNICSFAASSALNLSMCNFLWFCFVTCAGCRGGREPLYKCRKWKGIVGRGCGAIYRRNHVRAQLRKPVGLWLSAPFCENARGNNKKKRAIGVALNKKLSFSMHCSMFIFYFFFVLPCFLLSVVIYKYYITIFIQRGGGGGGEGIQER